MRVLNRNWGFHQCGSFWQPLLLTASILISCFLLNEAQGVTPEKISVTWKPVNPKEGQTVTLTPGGILEKFVSCNWYRGATTDIRKRIIAYYLPPYTLGQINGGGHTGRERVGANCSLTISNFASADFENYTVTKEGGRTEVGHANLGVVGRAETSNTIFFIVLGCLALTLVLIGTVVYFQFFRQGSAS